MTHRSLRPLDRLLVAGGGLCGAAGVGLSAVGAHLGGGNVATAANFLLFHAPLFIAVGLAAAPRLMANAALLLLVGLLLFAGDLLSRELAGFALFAMAAPLGGLTMIAGWLAIGASAPWLKRRGPPDDP